MPVLGFPDFDSCVEGLMADDPELTKESAEAICASAEEQFKVIRDMGIEPTDEQALAIYASIKIKLQEEAEPLAPDDDGNCPDGYVLGEDGWCHLPEPAPESKTKPNPESKLTLLNKKHSIKHKFSWPVPLLLEPGEEEAMMLFKGVAMTEGEMKRGEIMDKDNLLFATGAMSAAAMFGLAMMDIDHFETADELPAKYLEKYGKELADPYPPAFIIDAMVEENITEPNGKKLAQVEFIGAITNPLVWSMLKAGKFKGCSVVDYFRKETCDDCNGTDGTCKCSIEGSHFLMNTFILEEVPNSNGTWVEPLTAKDIGTIIERPSAELVEQLKLKMIKDPRMRMKTFLLEQNKKRHSAYDLDKYMDTESGQWLNGKSSIVEFLTEEKSLPETTANDMADYLWAHPDALNQYQYENMSPEDLVAWFRHIQEKVMQAKVRQLQKQVAAISALKHNAEGLKILKDIDMLSKDEVNYKEGEEGTSCQDCRWFFALDPADMPGPGMCAIVSGDILGTDTCDRFEKTAGEGGKPDDPGETPEPDAEHPEPVPPNDDGTCNDGWALDENTGMCVKLDQEDEPVEPDADGNCPAGWELVEIDGKAMCQMPEGVPEIKQKRLIKEARIFKLQHAKPKPTAIIEARAQVPLSIVRKQYEERKKKLEADIKGIGMIMGVGTESMKSMARLHSLKRDLASIELTLKKS